MSLIVTFGTVFATSGIAVIGILVTMIKIGNSYEK